MIQILTAVAVSAVILALPSASEPSSRTLATSSPSDTIEAASSPVRAPQSSLTFELQSSIAGLAQRLDKALPGDRKMPGSFTQVEHGADCTRHNGCFGYRYELDRGKLKMVANGSGWDISVGFSGRIEARKRKKFLIARPLISGHSNRFKGTVSVSVKPTIGPDWRVHARFSKPKVKFSTGVQLRDSYLGIFRRDVTGLVTGKLEGLLSKRLKKLDAEIRSRLDLAPTAREIWREAQAPLPLIAPGLPPGSLWIVLEPEGLGVGKLRTHKLEARANVTLTCRPRIVTGPPKTRGKKPLPPPGKAKAKPGFTAHLPIHVDLEAASRALDERLDASGGLQLPAKDPIASVKRIDLAATGSKLQATVEIHRGVRARLTFVGDPEFDPRSGKLRIENLQLQSTGRGLFERLRGRASVALVEALVEDSIELDLADLVRQAGGRLSRLQHRVGPLRIDLRMNPKDLVVEDFSAGESGRSGEAVLTLRASGSAEAKLVR